MASSTTKRVLVYRFDRQPIEAVVNQNEYLRESHTELMTAGGNLQKIAYGEVKAICFAKEPGRSDLFTEENLFERRPKQPGLWSRFVFRDGDLLDGILPHNLLDWPPQGYLFTPPRAGLTRQIVFVPREALSETRLMGVVGVPAHEKRKPRTQRPPVGQLSIFDR